jgi:mannose-6-phosphate isomerase-like protein (cupin superfamily)
MGQIRKLLFLLALATSGAHGQTASEAPPRDAGAATLVSNAEIESVLQHLDAKPVVDSVLRVVSIHAEYNVGVSIVRRRKVDGKTPPDAIVHREITEVYRILEGTGILVTGGTIEDEKEFPSDGWVVRTLVGPSSFGTGIAGGTRQRVGLGDVVIIPPNTPHGFSRLRPTKSPICSCESIRTACFSNLGANRKGFHIEGIDTCRRTSGCRGAPNSCAVRYPSRCARRRPLNRAVRRLNR